MTIGSSILMIVAGAILRYAVTWHIHGLNLPALGLILAIAGIITLVIRLIWLFNPDLGGQRPPTDPPAELGGWPANRSPLPPRGHASPPVSTGPHGWRPEDHSR
ncbi:hypothetical protein [Pseudofrankia asymbiotica]|uniref:Uncharacterized protein n=1 Tax=Pseudofrankia asymbiotica TaxID=1834516 RepID=A0A1V2ICL3_9ACTN|nr:hypothetical protein [Pseudofrankia asymbiotica]ONH30938.1 hypothetical protein BL253_11200 [Pseudofrankia asymbiotica]